MRSISSITLVLFAALPVSLPAQAFPLGEPLTPGMRVRVTHPGEGRRVGTIVALAPDTLSVRWAGNAADTARLPFDQVTRLEVSRGRQRDSRLARTGIGFLIGTGSGLLLGIAAAKSADCGANDYLGCSAAGGAAAMFFGLVGGGVGAAVGAATAGSHERWDRVPVPHRHVGLSISPQMHGGRIAVSLSLATMRRFP